MTEIPVTFDYKGKTYKGHFTPVSGAAKEGGGLYHLTIDGCHRGQMFLAPHYPYPHLPVNASNQPEYRWRFASQTGEFEELVNEFEDVLISWYQ